MNERKLRVELKKCTGSSSGPLPVHRKGPKMGQKIKKTKDFYLKKKNYRDYKSNLYNFIILDNFLITFFSILEM